jgi:hypothetical protein
LEAALQVMEDRAAHGYSDGIAADPGEAHFNETEVAKRSEGMNERLHLQASLRV